jgi:nicotinamide-nucleotide amidase
MASEREAIDLPATAMALADVLKRAGARFVLAESCTGGLASAALAGVPGISQWFCGSAVAYRPDAKSVWLQVPANVLEQHGAESAEATRAMARGALQAIGEADWSGAITGHLGPNSPVDRDGWIDIAVARRLGESTEVVCERLLHLDASTRAARQIAAARALLQLCHDTISAEQR